MPDLTVEDIKNGSLGKLSPQEYRNQYLNKTQCMNLRDRLISLKEEFVLDGVGHSVEWKPFLYLSSYQINLLIDVLQEKIDKSPVWNPSTCSYDAPRF